MTNVIAFVIGVFAGSTVGVMIAAVLMAGRDEEEYREKDYYYRGSIDNAGADEDAGKDAD